MGADDPSLLFHIVHNYFCLQTMVCNALLIFLIVRHTPRQLKSYSIMLLFMAVYESVSALTAFLLFPRIISLGNEALVCVIYGPCGLLSDPSVCYRVYGLLLNGLTFYNLQMTACFGFRYYILRRPTPSPKTTLVFNLVLASPTVLCLALFNIGKSQKELAIPLVSKYVPQYDLSKVSWEVMMDPLHTPAIATTLWVCITALPCQCINIYTGSSINSLLNRKSSIFAERTRASHRQFLKALVCQFLISQMFTVAVVSFVLGHFDVVKTPALEYAVHFLGEVCVAFSPLTTLYFVKPYRVKLMELVTRQHRVRGFGESSLTTTIK